ncbi:MAG: hypothetical protein NZM00_11470 [Anaerolinea sp.]|nr:hypothetical protein [Anaerolinea sp.]
MNFFSRLFGGRARPSSGDPDGLYFYVRPDGCDEIVRVRVHRYNDLSEHDDGGLWVRKSVRGTKCFTPVELELYFTAERKFVRHAISGGALVDEAAWRAYVDQQGEAGG